MMGLHVVLLFAIISGVEMFSLGAPDSACKSDMHPKHGDGVSVQKGPSPYTLTISQIDYRPKENIIVTLSGNTTFKGFLIMATTAPSSKDGQSASKTVGELTSFASTASRCEGSALTHTSNVTKRSVTFTWKSPDSDVGPVVFRYTVVLDKKTYWANMVSEKLEFNNGTLKGDEDDDWELDDEEYEYLDELWLEDGMLDFDDTFPDVTENVSVPTVYVSVTPTVDDNVTTTDRWRVPDKVEEDIKKPVGNKPDSGKMQGDTSKNLSGTKTVKENGPNAISNSGKVKTSGTEEVQSIKKTSDNGSDSSRLVCSSCLLGVSLFGITLLALV